MKAFRFKALLQNQGWLENVTVSLDRFGIITKISQEENTDSTQIDGYALPGFQNAHSHAFQYAMAGLAESHSNNGKTDDFWSWREAMYQLALNIDPEQMKSIAAMLYAELLRNGFTNVAEFHYIHHDKNGKAYADLATMSESLIEAAREAGIKITLIPIFYQKGGFGQPPNERQRRFISNNFEDYLKLFEASERACSQYEGANIGIGVHSLRGVDKADILKTVQNAPQNVPFHIHIAEQLKEIEESLQYLGKRPVEWLLENVEVNERFHLIHATHIDENETTNLAKTMSNVVICPSTEGNLGDGFFPLSDFQTAGGNWSIGTDSHIGLNPFEELRILDYGQRLKTHKRNTFSGENFADGGLYAITKAVLTGRKAMNNFSSVFFEVGAPFDACIVNSNEPLLANVKPEKLTSTIIYTTDSSQIYGTFVNGKLFRKDDRYFRIKEAFINCVKEFR